MVKKILPALIPMGFGIILLSSCAAFKPLNFTSNKQVAATAPSLTAQSKFIDQISVTAPATAAKTEVRYEQNVSLTDRSVNIVETPAPAQEDEISMILANGKRKADNTSIESANKVQLKYAVLMNVPVEELPSKSLLEAVDDWYGVRYRTGGNTKKGIDCSGFTEAVFLAVYGMQIPAVAREQYRACRKIATGELEEGDLVFFNTTGGVSHVGVYLGNSKFIHATVSKGVMVNGLYESYYAKRYIGGGRIDGKQLLAKD
jgi:cell wall-associated NlpC family hydrolase